MDYKEVIERLNLTPLPEEGGFYREVHRATGRILKSSSETDLGERCFSTHIYYLVTPEEFSGLHRVVGSDEIFHFYLGDPVEMIQLTEDGNFSQIILGQNIASNQSLHTVVPKKIWQGTRLLEGGKWALLGCTVAPGFEFEDFEIKSRAEFFGMFPQHKSEIERFTRELSKK